MLLGDIYTCLSGAATVTNQTTKIYPEKRSQDSETPAIVYYRAPGGERITDLQGYGNKENPIIEVTIYASRVDKRSVIADAVIAAMDTATGFTAILPDPPYDDYDDINEIYERTLQFSVWHST
jgi:hypothetical protein